METKFIHAKPVVDLILIIYTLTLITFWIVLKPYTKDFTLYILPKSFQQ